MATASTDRRALAISRRALTRTPPTTSPAQRAWIRHLILAPTARTIAVTTCHMLCAGVTTVRSVDLRTRVGHVNCATDSRCAPGQSYM